MISGARPTTLFGSAMIRFLADAAVVRSRKHSSPPTIPMSSETQRIRDQRPVPLLEVHPRTVGFSLRACGGRT
jgi:hypothetical protein